MHLIYILSISILLLWSIIPKLGFEKRKYPIKKIKHFCIVGHRCQKEEHNTNLDTLFIELQRFGNYFMIGHWRSRMHYNPNPTPDWPWPSRSTLIKSQIFLGFGDLIVLGLKLDFITIWSCTKIRKLDLVFHLTFQGKSFILLSLL